MYWSPKETQDGVQQETIQEKNRIMFVLKETTDQQVSYQKFTTHPDPQLGGEVKALNVEGPQALRPPPPSLCCKLYCSK